MDLFTSAAVSRRLCVTVAHGMPCRSSCPDSLERGQVSYHCILLLAVEAQVVCQHDERYLNSAMLKKHTSVWKP